MKEQPDCEARLRRVPARVIKAGSLSTDPEQVNKMWNQSAAFADAPLLDDEPLPDLAGLSDGLEVSELFAASVGEESGFDESADLDDSSEVPLVFAASSPDLRA
jgi:hypothetical protein